MKKKRKSKYILTDYQRRLLKGMNSKLRLNVKKAASNLNKEFIDTMETLKDLK